MKHKKKLATLTAACAYKGVNFIDEKNNLPIRFYHFIYYGF